MTSGGAHFWLRQIAGAAAVLWLTLSGTLSAADQSPMDLTGIVRDPDGQPVTNATVFVYTAHPRVGPGYT